MIESKVADCAGSSDVTGMATKGRGLIETKEESKETEQKKKRERKIFITVKNKRKTNQFQIGMDPVLQGSSQGF